VQIGMKNGPGDRVQSRDEHPLTSGCHGNTVCVISLSNSPEFAGRGGTGARHATSDVHSSDGWLEPCVVAACTGGILGLWTATTTSPSRAGMTGSPPSTASATGNTTFSAFIRSSNRAMPPYSEAILSNADLADIHPTCDS